VITTRARRRSRAEAKAGISVQVATPSVVITAPGAQTATITRPAGVATQWPRPPGDLPGTAPVPEQPATAGAKLYRRTDDRVLGGVASGLAEHLGLRPLHVRLVFLALLAFGGLGAVLYAVFWAVLSIDPAAEQRGRHRDTSQLVAFCVFALGIVVLLFARGTSSQLALVWCLGVVAVGSALVWRRTDPVQRKRWMEAAPNVPWLGAVLDGGRVMTIARLVGGVALVLFGLVGFLVFTGEWPSVRDGALFGLVLLTGVGLVIAPWLARTVTELRAERTERIRSQERAEIAAMVHDQVLHTLALIQRRADNPREVARLARGQERDLRNWLYKPSASADERLAAALEAAAAEVEDAYAVSVDAVVVGDCALDIPLNALVQAAREAMVNAGKHAGVATLSLYAEVEPEQVSVFIRDRGRGFDQHQVDDDRHGVRGSILGRMERHGGKAEIRSSPGAGTEVRLSMRRTTPDPQAAEPEKAEL
jgi:signal transduction histidine kinase